MYFKHLHAFIAFTVGCMLLSCHEKDVNLNNIDPTAEIDMGLALPIGTVSATMGDFLGAGQIEQIYVDEYGIFHFKSRLDIPTKPYHSIDLKDYIFKNAAQLPLNVSEKVPAGTTIWGTGMVDIPIPAFDVDLTFSGINDDTSDERIDSIWITQAVFSSWIDVEDFDLQWDEIKSVKLVLDSNQFRREEMEIELPISGKNFQEKLEITVDDFTINLLKDQSDPDKGTVNKLSFKLQFVVCPKAGHNITVMSTSKIKYDLSVDLLDYDAIWGFFEAGNQMRNTDTICLKKEWPDWENMKKLKMRFAEPRIDVYITHRVAAPLIMYMDYIKAIDSVGNVKPATWNGKTSKAIYFEDESEYISPISPLKNHHEGDSVTLHELFSYEEDKGNIDELFDVRPDSFIYSFHLSVNRTALHDDPNWSKWKQLRILKDTRVYGHAVADVPFKFNEGSEIAYTSVIDSVNLSKVRLDSMITLNAADLKLILTVDNGIPFDIQGSFTFLDKDSVDMGLQLVEGNTTNTFHFPAPKMNAPTGPTEYGTVIPKSSVTPIIVNVSKNDLDRLDEIKKIRFDAQIAGNPQRCVISKTTGLKVTIGIAGQINALIDPSKKENK